ncbi:MAG: choice-of-anchor Q domain-containing protein, partial [Wenzhouxiangella sp.]
MPVDGCSTGSLGADEIVFDPGLAQATITLAAGQLEVFNDLSITGPVVDDAGGIVIDGNAQSRILFIEGSMASEFVVGLTGMTLTNGFESGSDGGAVHVNFADLDLDHVTVSDSSTESSSVGGILVRNGNLSLTSSSVTRNSTERDVGGLWVPDGNLNLISSTVSDNSADRSVGGAALGADADGSLYMIDSTVSGNSALSAAGGLLVGTGPGQTTSIFDSTFSNNTTTNSMGGALFIQSPDVEMTNVVVTGNSVNGGSDSRYGGGAWLGQGNMILTDVMIAGNSVARHGGGLFVRGTNLTLNDSRIINNSVTGDFPSAGGAMFIYQANVNNNNTTISGNTTESPGSVSRGGGLYVDLNSEIFLNNSTISGNSAQGDDGQGGGIHLIRGSNAALMHTTLANNTAASGADGIHLVPPTQFIDESQFSLNNSLIFQAEAGQTACSTQATSHSNSLATDISCTGTATSLSDIALQPLADNGGPTLTHALGRSSVAIESAGDCVADFGIDTDQRGMQRPGIDSSAC